MVLLGWPLHPDLQYLELTRDIIEEDADYFEINPEALWRPSRHGGLERNDFHQLFQQIQDRSKKPFVAHGLDFSPGTPLPGDRARTRAWLDRLHDDQETFHFEWMSEHLGWTTAAGLQAVLPLPLPLDDESIATVATRLRLLSRIVPTVCFENNPTYFNLGDPAREPEFFNAICRAAPCGLLLDLHNVHTQCRNFGLDPVDYVTRIDLSNVVQIHLSGGSESDAAWLPSKRVFRLDSHDGPVPEPVWKLLEIALPRCANLRGLVVERLNGTFDHVRPLAEEFWRAKEMVHAR
jgi:hypothetical protein